MGPGGLTATGILARLRLDAQEDHVVRRVVFTGRWGVRQNPSWGGNGGAILAVHASGWAVDLIAQIAWPFRTHCQHSSALQSCNTPPRFVAPPRYPRVPCIVHECSSLAHLPGCTMPLAQLEAYISSIVNMYSHNGLEQCASVDINAQLLNELSQNPPPSLL